MQKTNPSPGSRWPNALFGLIALLIITADQLTKAWINANLALGQSVPFVGFFHLTHIRNTGAAFGQFQGQFLPLAISSCVAIVVILVFNFAFIQRFPFLNNIPGKLTLGLILGGVAGNLIDRLRFGYVTDFLDAGFWPTFNVADSAATIGITILVIILLFAMKNSEG